MKKIKMIHGNVALVDDEDFEVLSKYGWSRDSLGYAQRRARRGEYPAMIRMHRQIMGYPELEIDHIDRNKLNNQRKNLRVCTTSQNMINRGKSKRNTSGFLGITYIKKNKCWRAQIMSNKRKISKDGFKTPEDAARCRDFWASVIHGKYAELNFPIL